MVKLKCILKRQFHNDLQIHSTENWHSPENERNLSGPKMDPPRVLLSEAPFTPLLEERETYSMICVLNGKVVFPLQKLKVRNMYCRAFDIFWVKIQGRVCIPLFVACWVKPKSTVICHIRSFIMSWNQWKVVFYLHMNIFTSLKHNSWHKSHV